MRVFIEMLMYFLYFCEVCVHVHTLIFFNSLLAQPIDFMTKRKQLSPEKQVIPSIEGIKHYIFLEMIRLQNFSIKTKSTNKEVLHI